MDFSDALRAMKKGKKLQRSPWSKHPYLSYICIDEEFLHSVKHVTIIGDEVTEHCFSFSNEDIRDKDWEIVEDKK